MSITLAALATYAQDFVCDNADATSLTNITTQVLEDELPANDFNATQFLTAAVAATAEYTLSTSMRKLYSILYGGRPLSYERLESLQAQGPTWLEDLGIPRAWTERLQEERTIRVYPAPAQASVGTSNVVTETDRFVSIGTAVMSSIPDYLRLPVMLWILAREYERESNHRDLTFAKIARAMAEGYFRLAEGIPEPQG